MVQGWALAKMAQPASHLVWPPYGNATATLSLHLDTTSAAAAITGDRAVQNAID
jgi:hypothetical protein